MKQTKMLMIQATVSPSDTRHQSVVHKTSNTVAP